VARWICALSNVSFSFGATVSVQRRWKKQLDQGQVQTGLDHFDLYPIHHWLVAFKVGPDLFPKVSSESPQYDLVAFCKEHNIHITAYSHVV
jgi:diketogulonate reductase-like aldo/keto reductase